MLKRIISFELSSVNFYDCKILDDFNSEINNQETLA